MWPVWSGKLIKKPHDYRFILITKSQFWTFPSTEEVAADYASGHQKSEEPSSLSHVGVFGIWFQEVPPPPQENLSSTTRCKTACVRVHLQNLCIVHTNCTQKMHSKPSLYSCLTLLKISAKLVDRRLRLLQLKHMGASSVPKFESMTVFTIFQ